MKQWKKYAGCVGLMTVLVLALSPASAFVLSNGRPSENVSGAGARAPGLMVGAGIARNAARVDDFQSVNDIVETSKELSLVDQFLPEWIDIVFERINSALDLLINTLFLRAGQTPPALSLLTNTTATGTAKTSLRGALVTGALERLDRSVR